MKISKLFHTLYAFLMVLPVMVLPLFAININQKEVEPLTAQIDETQLVDFNQKLKLLNLDSTINIDEYSTITINTEDYFFNVVGSYASESSSFEIYISDYFTLNNNHLHYFRFFNFNDTNLKLHLWGDNQNLHVAEDSASFIFNSGNFFNYRLFFQINTLFVGDLDYSFYLNIFDLTQMFGSGNEPTMQQFDTWYPNDYYQYSTGKKEILYTGVVDTLDNADVGSQFLYSLYNPLKDYFNLPNYMNLGGLYNWFLANLFSGYNTPVYFIIFTLMIYWLALSLLWLIFDVLMYVPSMIHKMLDKARME